MQRHPLRRDPGARRCPGLPHAIQGHYHRIGPQATL